MDHKIDILNRQPFVDMTIDIIRTLSENKKGCTFTIDGQWGCGKSYVLDMIEQQLSVYQDPKAAGDRYIILRYNSWQYDFYEEPAIAIVSAIKNEIEKYNSILESLSPGVANKVRTSIGIAKSIGEDLLSKYFQTKLGFDPLELGKMWNAQCDKNHLEQKEKNEYDTYFQFKMVLDSTKTQLAKLAQDKSIILIVDELDRCLPEYAIKVLERLHHFFDDNSNVIVILATDHRQLERTVEKIFGKSNDQEDKLMVTEYLKKFIDFSITLDNGSVTESFWTRYNALLSNYNVNEDNGTTLFCELPQKLFAGIDVRSQEQIMDHIATLHSLSFGDNNSACVLYFELLHQILLERFHTSDFSWIIDINLCNNVTWEKTLGNDLYQYLKELEQGTHSTGTQTLGYNLALNYQQYDVLDDTSIAKVFWLLATLCEMPQNSNCCHYHLKNSSELDNLVECATKFDEIAKHLL